MPKSSRKISRARRGTRKFLAAKKRLRNTCGNSIHTPLNDSLDAIKSVNAANALCTARRRGALAKPKIEAASGPAISAGAAAMRMKCTSQLICTLIGKGELVGYRRVSARKELLLPLWQFDSDGAAHPWVTDLVEAYGANGWAFLNFVTAPRLHLKGRSYLHLLRSNNVAEVLLAAKRSNPE